MSARLFVVSGPSGVGKGTLIQRVARADAGAGAWRPRPPPGRRAPGEVDGRDYHFLSQADFAQRVGEGAFLEHVSYAGNRYGTLRSEVERRLQADESVILEIEVVGAGEIKHQMPDAVLVFVAPPTFADLEHRLKQRNTDRPDEIERRVEIARGEMEAQPQFDYTVVNDDIDRAADELASIVRAATQAEERP